MYVGSTAGLEEMVRAGGGDGSDDDDARSIRTIVPHKLERVDQEDDCEAGAAAGATTGRGRGRGGCEVKEEG